MVFAPFLVICDVSLASTIVGVTMCLLWGIVFSPVSVVVFCCPQWLRDVRGVPVVLIVCLAILFPICDLYPGSLF